ncbi:hypothetical protein COI60_24875 [Bacillus toyonensis]|uniref:hypothetical protein n=1 Tax=Bacillus toyonensis TaxID=155322 RepID=UPI000BFC5A57|nr:hypothetical protein [Bacillus toyonensis]PHG30408.1 hypothetical protein COI60_24875 [Bacillus toyonensis]
MLSTKLKKLYENNKVLSEEFPFDEYYPLLRNFIVKEVSLDAEYLSPYRFALTYGIPPKNAIRFFMGLTDDRELLQQHYKYDCEICDHINIIVDEDQLVDFRCIECGFEDHLITKEYLSEVKLLFKISDELLEEIQHGLKENPLSEDAVGLKILDEGTSITNEVSLGLAQEIAGQDGKYIGENAKAIQKRIDGYKRLML